MSLNDVSIRLTAAYVGHDQMMAAITDLKAVTAAAPQASNTMGGLGQAQTVAAQGAREHEERLASLHGALGTTRRETMFLERSVLDLSGTTGVAAHGLEALATGVSAPIAAMVGLAAVAMEVKQGYEAAQKQWEQSTKSLLGQTSSIEQANVAMREFDQTTQASLAASFQANITNPIEGIQHIGALGRYYQQLTAAVKDQTLAQIDLNTADRDTIESMQGVYGALVKNTLAEADARQVKIAALQAVGQVERDAASAMVDAAIKAAESAKTHNEYQAAILKLAEAYAPLNYEGKQWKDLMPEQQAAMLSLAQGVATYNAYMTEAANRTVTFVEQVAAAPGVMDSLAVALAKNSAALHNNAGAFVEETDAQGEAVSRGAEMAVKIAGWTKERIDQKLAESKAHSAAESEAKAQAALYAEIAAASAVASPKIQADFQAIMHSAGDAALHTKELHTYLSSLPADVKSKIQLAIDFGGNMDLAKAVGLGQPQAASHDWLKEFNATFAEQKADIQQKFVQDAGGNKDLAQQNWGQQHNLEMQQRMLDNPQQFTNVGDGAAKGMQTALMNVKPSEALSTAFTKDKKNIESVGTAMGEAVMGNLTKAVVDSAGDTTDAFVKALVGLLDSRYMQIAHTTYVPPAG